MTSSDPEIIYIGGYGRSGSTILDILLSQEPSIFGAGELFFLFEDWASPDRKCSCGEVYRSCSFWSELESEVDVVKAKEIIRSVENANQISNIRDGLLPTGLRREYEALQQTLLRYIQRKSGSRIIIDSSKTKGEMAARALAWDRLTPAQVKMIHLMRSGRVTVRTILQKGSNWSLEGHRQRKRLIGLRAANGWKKANLFAKSYSQLLPANRYIPLKYEDLQSKPLDAVQRLETALGLPLNHVKNTLSQNTTLDVGHRVGGNRIRFESNLLFRQQPEDLKRLDPIHEIAFRLIAGNLSKSLGYD